MESDNKAVQSTIPVEVAYALPDRQEIIALNVEQGCTALEAVKLSGIAKHFSEIVPDEADMGIFSKALDGKAQPLPSEYVLEPKDRVEIYRPLQIDPKQARLARAEKAKKAKEMKAAEQAAKE